jgi:hypothetical protein
MKKQLAASLLVVSSLSYMAGCGSSAPPPAAAPASAAAAAAPDTQPSIPIPPGSPFARLRMEESMDEVYATIGPPTSTTANPTGKAFIPFYRRFGGDTYHLQALYKGIGTVTFGGNGRYSSGMYVRDITYDPSESGYPQE